MAKRARPVDKVAIDPIFAIPEGAEDQFVPSRDDFEIDYDSDAVDDGIINGALEFEFDFAEEETLYDDGSDDDDPIELMVPEGFVIISQTLRRAPGGQQVVDVVVETDDVPGATHYELRVTKV